ncbi:MAG TPA: phenylacetate--CoA ligase family protein, partial [Desulfitobacterium dehalogenans]|nr:phenylacetate--CoA ligase family protein [Desulfitobacterium dehalogenans]
MTPEKTPLESWIGRKITGSSSGVFTSECLKAYQLNKLGETLDYVREKSPFYQRHLGKNDYTLTHLEDVAKLPFTMADDLRRFGQEMMCVKPSDIHRIVTLQTSGTTGQPKRVFFTEEDQELTLDFFHQGMLTMVKPGDRVLILLPGRVPGSVGEL